MNKKQQNLCHANVNINSIEENVTRIKSGITINMNVKFQQKIMRVKYIIFGILLHVL